MLRIKAPEVHWAKWVWNKAIPKRVSVTMWKALLGSLCVDSRILKVEFCLIWTFHCDAAVKENSYDHLEEADSGDEFGKVMAGFTSQLGEATNTEADLRAIIEGLNVCQQLGACVVEIECDSLIIVNWLINRKCTVWYPWDFWEELFVLINLFEVHVMHQYREGNQVAEHWQN
ncbi:unnamed protein product [Fraxinus pennsylvanica]|uniref:RNase H type-1 domain-containing protein n=1 Tax=Fraxinus pennsylvanica TaxID=56036 RepID=A0AAD1YYG5_9LAMI|nr:unnamed protein product [Fraxinus pennsylvanica]